MEIIAATWFSIVFAAVLVGICKDISEEVGNDWPAVGAVLFLGLVLGGIS